MTVTTGAQPSIRRGISSGKWKENEDERGKQQCWKQAPIFLAATATRACGSKIRLYSHISHCSSTTERQSVQYFNVSVRQVGANMSEIFLPTYSYFKVDQSTSVTIRSTENLYFLHYVTLSQIHSPPGVRRQIGDCTPVFRFPIQRCLWIAVNR